MVAENAQSAAHERDEHTEHSHQPSAFDVPSSRPPNPDSRHPSSSSRPPLPPRDPALNALICAILDPYESIEEIAKDRGLTVIQLASTLSSEPATTAIDTLRKVFSLRAEMLALHARAAAVGRLTRITTNCDDDETARRAATTLLRMFRPDGAPAPLPPDRSTPNRATDRGSARSVSAQPSHATPPDRATDRGSARSVSGPPSPSLVPSNRSPCASSGESSEHPTQTTAIAGPPATQPQGSASGAHSAPIPLDDPTSPTHEREPDHPATTDAPSRERVPTPAMRPSSAVIAGSRPPSTSLTPGSSSTPAHAHSTTSLARSPP